MLRTSLQKSKFSQVVRTVIRGQAAFAGRNTPKRNYDENTVARTEKCLNSVQLLGRVGQDPKVAGQNRKVVQFSMATSIYYSSPNDNDMQSKTSWHNVAVFRPYLQEKVENYVRKGSRVLVQGSLDYSTFTDDNGSQRTNVSIIPDDIIILATPGREGTSY